MAFSVGHEGLSVENSEKSLERGFWGLSAPGPGGVKRGPKITIFQFFGRFLARFSPFFDFLSFFDPGAERLREPLSDFFPSFFGRGCLNPCKRQRCPHFLVRLELEVVGCLINGATHKMLQMGRPPNVLGRMAPQKAHTQPPPTEENPPENSTQKK